MDVTNHPLSQTSKETVFIYSEFRPWIFLV